MKTLNQFRKTNRFNLTGSDLEHLAAIGSYFSGPGRSIVGVANDPTDDYFGRYVVRVIDREVTIDPRTGKETQGATAFVTDFLVEVIGRQATILDSAKILGY